MALSICYRCGFWDSDYGACTCPSTDRWYACKFENTKPDNIKALKEYSEKIYEESEEKDAT